MARLAREMDGKHARPRACSPPHGAVYSQHNDGASARGSARAWLFCDPRMPCHLRTCAFALVSPSYRRRDTERVARTAASLRACEARRHAHVHVHDPHPVHPAHPLSARMENVLRLSVSSRLIAVPTARQCACPCLCNAPHPHPCSLCSFPLHTQPPSTPCVPALVLDNAAGGACMLHRWCHAVAYSMGVGGGARTAAPQLHCSRSGVQPASDSKRQLAALMNSICRGGRDGEEDKRGGGGG